MALPKLYEQITWVNDTTPALNEDNLNAMSQALDDIDDRVIGLAGTIMEDVPQIIEDMAILEPAIESIDDNVARAEAAADSAEQYAEEIAPPIEVVKDFAPIITIEDAINKAAKDVKVKVDAVQDLHGYTKPWVGGAGKQLIPMTVDGIKAANTSGTWSGNVYTWETMTFTILVDSANNVLGIKVNGTNSSSSQRGFRLPDGAISAGSYILSGSVGGSYSSYWINFYSVSGSSNVADCVNSNSAFTLSSGITARATIYVAGSATINNVTFSPMVSKSTESTTFEPYTNICPITGHSEAKVTRAAHNLLKNNGVSTTKNNVTFTVNSDKSITISTTNAGASANASFEFNSAIAGLKPNKTYKVSGGNSLSNNVILSLTEYNGASYVANLADVKTSADVEITPTFSGYDTIHASVFVKSGTVITTPITVYPLIELATDTNTTYEPYKGEVYTIDLDGTRYGGVLDVDAGTLTLNKGIAEPITFTARSSTTSNNLYLTDAYANMKKPSSHQVVANVISNRFETVYYDYIYGRNAVALGITTEGKIGIGLGLDGPSTLADANTWLSNNPMQIVYELATPQTIQLTAEEVELLLGYNTLWADTGDLSLTYDASGVLRIANAKLDIDTFKSIVAASSDFADFKSRVAAL